MNIKRALGISFLIYLGSFISGMLMPLVFRIDSTAPVTEVPPEVWYAGAFMAAVFTVLGTWWYFKGSSLQANLISGIKFGLIVIALGFVIDLLLFFLFSLSGEVSFSDIFVYYTQPLFWMTLVLVITSAAATAHFSDSTRS